MTFGDSVSFSFIFKSCLQYEEQFCKLPWNRIASSNALTHSIPQLYLNNFFFTPRDAQVQRETKDLKAQLVIQ